MNQVDCPLKSLRRSLVGSESVSTKRFRLSFPEALALMFWKMDLAVE